MRFYNGILRPLFYYFGVVRTGKSINFARTNNTQARKNDTVTVWEEPAVTKIKLE